MPSFLQDHYNRYRGAGGDHFMYVVVNDIAESLAEELRHNFETTHSPVPEEITIAFQERALRQAREAALRGNLAWMTGTGRYAQ